MFELHSKAFGLRALRILNLDFSNPRNIRKLRVFLQDAFEFKASPKIIPNLANPDIKMFLDPVTLMPKLLTVCLTCSIMRTGPSLYPFGVILMLSS